MIPLKEAQEQNFSKSTRAELLAYAQELGIENIPHNANAAQLRRMVCNTLGIALEAEGKAAPAPKVSTTAGGDTIFPSYNLTPNGIWGGRRHRIQLPRPEGSKMAQAEAFSWNGKHPYYVPFDEPDSVPEPIYNIIVQNKRRRVVQQASNNGEITTAWEFDGNPLIYLGVDEETKDRAGSLLEWYQARGSQWFHDLTPRQLQQVAQKLEVSMVQHMGDKIPPRPLGHEELRDRVLEFLYGYADAKVEPNPAIRP